jgi:hypothetical protein
MKTNQIIVAVSKILVHLNFVVESAIIIKGKQNFNISRNPHPVSKMLRAQ